MKDRNERRRQRYAEDPVYREKQLAAGRKRYAEDEQYRSEQTERRRINHRKEKEKRREEMKSNPLLREQWRLEKADSRLKSQYGLTLAEYNAILLRQHGGCGICGRKPGKRRLCVDHCHLTHQVRGLLCTGCNTGLGNYRDDPELMRRGSAYLEAWRKRVGLEVADDGAQLAFDFGPCDQPKLVPPKRRGPARRKSGNRNSRCPRSYRCGTRDSWEGRAGRCLAVSRHSVARQ